MRTQSTQPQFTPVLGLSGQSLPAARSGVAQQLGALRWIGWLVLGVMLCGVGALLYIAAR